MPIRIGCIADDFTGATDLAGELVKSGLSAAVSLGVPAAGTVAGADAVVIALKSRSIAAQDAVRLSLAALEWLKAAAAERIYFKYCSTFDSTPAGNIGPVLFALRQATGAGPVIACPAFPANGRTVYRGHLFVGDLLLNRSGMERHPLNPMTESDLVAVLQTQYPEPVGRLTLPDIQRQTIDQAIGAQVQTGHSAIIADAVDDASLDILGRWCADQPLASGGSGLAAAMGRAISSGEKARPVPLPASDGRRAILAGSCSATTLGQIAFARSRLPSLFVRPGTQSLDEIRTWVKAQDPDAPVLIHTSQPPEGVDEARRLLGEDAESQCEQLLADVAAMLVDDGAGAMIVAGGETSGAVMNRLAISNLAIGPEIAPGVPWTIAERTAGKPLLLALKSGNFGAADLFLDAWRHLP